MTEPEAIASAQRKWPDLKFADDVDEALAGAELVFVLTEWKQYIDRDPARGASLVANLRVLDERNCLKAVGQRDAEFSYRALGRR